MERSRGEVVNDGHMMAEFLRTPYWAVLSKYLRAGFDSRIARLLVPAGEGIEFVRGEAMAFRELLNLPENLVREGEHLAKQEMP